MKARILLGAMLATLFAVTTVRVPAAWALSLDEAKQQGLVGETPSGYLEPVKANPDAQRLAQEINAQRRNAYQQIAQRNGSPINAVEQIAGKEAIEKSPPGTFVKMPSGQWRRK